ncbi:FAD-dependent oxidoreductase [Anoxybacterium hadale]|uniref:FAD-dependent oxidoreductase n=1 Tax=Anoxybacterium hadale TaxID=3408580 RepID=A0ACD1AD33_9FIRM|nr:FAD-dependent oxidoreductase [Clostridiales bacterium]
MNHLFMEGRIGGLVLKNRIIMTAIHSGLSIEKETAFLAERVKGGAAAVTAVMGVSKTGAPFNMCVLEPEIMEALRAMTNEIHQDAGKLFIQLFHAGRNAARGSLADKEALPIAPSAIPSPIYKQVPRALETDEIAGIIQQFGQAASLCKAAGVDGVEISCSAGYLLSQFFSPLTNHRIDEYGGDEENRMRFPLEVIREVRRSVGSNFPIILRVSASDMLGGYGIKDTMRLLLKAESYLDAVNVTGGWHESEVPQISMHLPEGGFAFLAREIKRTIKIPVIACNRINNGDIAREIVEEDYGDFAGCARAFLADSEFVNKLEREMTYRRCIGCNKGCIERVLKMQEVSCVFNPEVGREGEKAGVEGGLQRIEGQLLRRGGTVPGQAGPLQIKKEQRRKTLVVGGGAAGIEAALQCAKQGDEVTLCTSENKIGGLLHAASKAPYKETIAWNLKAMNDELERSRVNVMCNQLVESSFIELYKPDFVVVATGSRPALPPIPGIDQKHVITAQQVLEEGNPFARLLLKGSILVLGGGSVGLETALYLTKSLKLQQLGSHFLYDYAPPEIQENLICGGGITIVEMGAKMGADLGGLRRIMLKELRRHGVALIDNARVEQISEKEVTLNLDGRTVLHGADTVIVAAGYEPQGQVLIQWLEKNGQYPHCVIGDAQKIGNIGKALKDAYALCRR